MQDLLEDLALRVSDRAPIDWDQMEVASKDLDESEILANLRILDLLAEFHGQDPSQALESWGPLDIIEKTDQGSFGEVFRAFDGNLQRQVALKLYDAAPEDSPQSREKLLLEGRLLARVRHPNVVTVFGADEHGGRVGIWMEFIDGATLEQILHKDGPRDARQAAEIGVRLCKALTAIHRQGLIHRDVKAQNVMREADGRIVLMDLGLGVEQKRQRLHSIGGTPLYMAPELLRGEPASVQSDLYALGVLLFHLVTADFPAAGGSLEELREIHQQGRYVPVLELRPGLEPGFCQIIDTTLQSDPGQRPSSAQAMQSQLEDFLDPASLPRRRRWASLLKGAAAAGLLLALLTYFLVFPYLHRRTAIQHLSQAHLHYAAQNIELAIQAAQLATAADPSFAEGHRLLSVYLQAVGRHREALQASQRAYDLRESETEVEFHRVEATFFFQRLLYEEALDAYNSVILLDDGDAQAYRQIAHLKNHLRNLSGAIAAAQKAVHLEPENVISQGTLALLKLQQGRPLEEILQGLQAARQEVASDATYLKWPEGLAYLVAGDFQQAEQAFAAMIRGNPEFSTEGRIMQAQALLCQGRFLDAIQVLRTGASQDAGKGFERSAFIKKHLLAASYAWLGEKGSALDELKGFLELQALPPNLKLLRKAALLYLDLGQVQAAQDIHEKIGQIQQGFPSPLSQGVYLQVKGMVDMRRGKEPEAHQSLAMARREWEDFYLDQSEIRLAIQQGRCRQALPLLRQEIIDKPARIFHDGLASSWVLAHLDLAYCSHQQGDIETAFESCRLFLDLWGDAEPLPSDFFSAAQPDFCRRLPQQGSA